MSILPAIKAVASIANAGVPLINQALENRSASKLADYQYNKDLEMWNRGNAYNAPEAQMERLKKAGLNPNLVYGSGSVSGNTTGQLPKYQAPQMKYNVNPISAGMEMISAFQNFQDRNEDIQSKRIANEWLSQRNKYQGDQGADFDSYSYWNQKMIQETNATESSWWNQMKDRLILDYMRQSKPLEIEKSQVDIARSKVDNAIRNLDLEYYKFDKYAKYGAVVGGLGAVARGIVKSGSPAKIYNYYRTTRGLPSASKGMTVNDWYGKLLNMKK